jgi:hypothetical protein
MTYGRLFTVPSTKNPTHASQNRRPCTVPVRAASPSPPPELASALSSVSVMSKRDVMSWSSSLTSPSLDAARRRDEAFIEVMSCWQEETCAATVDQIGGFRAANGFLCPWRATCMTLYG